MAGWLPPKVLAASTKRVLKPGQMLFRAGQPVAGFYEVLQGNVKLVRVDRTGREAILHVATPGDTLAEASLFAHHYHCDAIATKKSVVLLYPKSVVLREFERHPSSARAFTAMLAQRVMDLRTRLEQRNIHSARERIRHYLMLNVAEDGRTVRISGSLKSLAGELGLTHEALYRTLAEMVADGEIARQKGIIKLA